MTFWDFIIKWLQNLLGLDLMLEAMQAGKPIPAQAYLNLAYSSLMLLLGAFVIFRVLYLLLGVFGHSKKYPMAPKDKRYCFIVPARNEELVIANLIESVRALDYPQNLIDIMVIADNCDPEDKTAEIARAKGAIVFEHNDPNERRAGFALRYGFNELAKTCDLVEDYYCYIRLDADNVVPSDFLTHINNCLQATGADEIEAYRNAKNLSENWVTAISGMNVYNHPLNSQRARSMLDLNQEIYGPGACYRSHLVKDGWLWDGLCEDADAMADLTARGYKTGYCEEAQIYEEEPNRVGIFVRQQMRWTKGLWHTFFTFGPRLVKSFFKKPTWSKYDIFWQIFPYSQVTFFFGLTYQIISLILFGVYGDNGFNWWSFGNYVLTLLGGIYVTTFLLDLVTIIREWKRFHLPLGKTIVYLFLFPLYQIINLPVSTAAVFMRVKWKHIDHHFVIDPTLLVEEEKAKNSKKPASAKQ